MTETAGKWLRVSTMAQDEVSQEPDVDRWIASKGYEEGPTYRVHGASAFHGKHEPELRRALEDLKAGRTSVLVVWKSDRIDRQEKLGALIREAQSYGGRIEFVTEPELNMLAGLGGRVMTVVKEWANAEESRTKSDRVKIKQSALRASGSWCNGKAPYGYQVAPTGDGRKTLAPLGPEAPHVATIFELAAQGKTCLQICRALKVPTREGKPDWSEGTIGQIIRNEVYRGQVLDANGRPYMTVPALTTPALWLQANEALKSRARSIGRGSKGRTSTVLLRPVCGRCGGPMYRYGVTYRDAGLGPAGNSTQRKACGEGRWDANTIKVEELDREVLAYFEGSDEPEVTTTTVEAEDWSEEIASVRLQLRDLDDLSDTYDTEHAAGRLELRRLLKAQEDAAPARVEELATGRTEGQAFEALDPEGKRAWLRARYVIRVYPEPTLWEGRVTRWQAGYIGPRA